MLLISMGFRARPAAPLIRRGAPPSPRRGEEGAGGLRRGACRSFVPCDAVGAGRRGRVAYLRSRASAARPSTERAPAMTDAPATADSSVDPTGSDPARTDLVHRYRAYIACLNAQDWDNLGRFVHDEATHNGRPFGLAGYRAMLEKDFSDIPDLRFNIGLLIADPPHIAARLDFHCSPKGEFLGVPVNGRTISFSENVFYRFQDGKVAEVWSVVDKVAVEGETR